MSKTIYYVMGDFIKPQFDENGEEVLVAIPWKLATGGMVFLCPSGFFDRIENKDGIKFVEAAQFSKL